MAAVNSEARTVYRSGFSLVRRMKNQLLAGYGLMGHLARTQTLPTYPGYVSIALRYSLRGYVSV